MTPHVETSFAQCTSSYRMLRPLFTSPIAQCLPTTQQARPNQAHQWAWILRDVHLGSLIHVVFNVARVVSQHTLLYDAESPGQLLHFFTLLPQKLEDVLSSFRPVLPDRGWNLAPPYLPVWSHETTIQWLPLSVTLLLRVKPKMYEDKRFELEISRHPRLAGLFESLRWFLFTKPDKLTEILKSWNISCLWLSEIIINGLWVWDLGEIYYKALEVCKVVIYWMFM